jgi:hypothetical protein
LFDEPALVRDFECAIQAADNLGEVLGVTAKAVQLLHAPIGTDAALRYREFAWY